jgi:signal transduction histidine kinase
MRNRHVRRVPAWGDLHLNLRVASLAILGIVVLALAVLQYRWIDEVSQAQEIRAASREREQIRVISDALDTEITRPALFFTILSVPVSSIYDALEQRWATWNHDAPWPQIVSGVALVESTAAGWRKRSLGEAGTFDLRAILPAEVFAGSLHPGADALRIPEGFVHGQPYLLRPLPTVSEPSGEQRMNWVLIRYNLGYVTSDVFPRLLEKHSAAEDRLDFRFQIGLKGPIAPGTITVAEGLHYRPDCLMPNRGVGAVLSVGRADDTRGPVSPVGALASPLVFSQGASASALLHAAGQCQMPVSPSSPGLMQLTVRHPQGALSDVYAGFRRHNEILSGLVLVALLAALATLVVSAERVRRLARLQTVIAAGISHELRSPLASLSVAADDLKNGHVETAEQARRYGEILDAQFRRLRHVVDQALALTGLGEGKRAHSLLVVSIPEILDAAVDALTPMLNEAGIEIERRIAHDAPRILADPDLVQRCVTNLIENSIKYARSGGSILLSVRAGRHAGRPVAEVTVEDRGPGIRAEEAAAVFEPFYRGDSALLSRLPGSGLGLAIVKSAVEAQGGWIKLERAVPHGCRFQLFFLADDAAGAALRHPGVNDNADAHHSLG